MLRVTTQCVIRTTVHPISRRYRTDNFYLHRKYINGRWYLDWMIDATNSIMQCRGKFVYSNGTFPELYPKQSNNSMQGLDKLQEVLKDIGIPDNLKSYKSLGLCGW